LAQSLELLWQTDHGMIMTSVMTQVKESDRWATITIFRDVFARIKPNPDRRPLKPFPPSPEYLSQKSQISEEFFLPFPMALEQRGVLWRVVFGRSLL
jgi:hypothetical protein